MAATMRMLMTMMVSADGLQAVDESGSNIQGHITGILPCQPHDKTSTLLRCVASGPPFF